jgi:hypothetical protein
MTLGDLVVTPFEGGENIAQYVGFAASVESDSSAMEAIERIGKQLGQATVDNTSIKLVSAPLLGAGAGGLTPEVVVNSLGRGFKSSANPDSRLVIYVLDEGVFRRLSTVPKNELLEKRATPEQPIRVFISYCHSSPKHEKWVEELGCSLRENGIDARLDIWNLRRGMDLPQFMTNELALAQRVVLISDEKYAEKADGRVGGVGWETMIVQGDMARQAPDSNKYLVIVTSSSLEAGLPQYLKTKFVIHWPDSQNDEHNLQLLLRELYDAVQVAPSLGQKPLFL